MKIMRRKSKLKAKTGSLKDTITMGIKQFLSRKWVGNPDTTSKE